MVWLSVEIRSIKFEYVILPRWVRVSISDVIFYISSRGWILYMVKGTWLLMDLNRWNNLLQINLKEADGTIPNLS